MIAVRVQLVGWLLGLSSLVAQTVAPANVEKVQVVNAGEDVRIEVTLTTSVKPSVIVATNPDRLVLELPNTASDGKQKHVPSHSPGVRGVRIGLHQSDPPLTRLVVDLDRSVPYKLSTENNRITLVLSPGPATTAATHAAPARAVSGGLIGIFRAGSKPIPPSSTSNDAAQIPYPPPGPTSPPQPAAPSATAQADAPAGNSNPANTTSGASAQNAKAEAGTIFPSAISAPQKEAVASPQTSAATQAPVVTTQAPAVTAPVAVPPPPSVAQAAAPSAAATAEQATAESTPPAATSNSAPPNAEEVANLKMVPIPAEPAPEPADSAVTDQTLLALQATDPSLRTVFRVKYVADGVAYLDGGSSSGLGEGMKLEIRDSNLPVQQGTIVDPNDPRVISELQVTGVAETSAAADIHAPKRPVKVGDLAYLSTNDAQLLIQQRTLSATRKYPAVVTFTQDDTMDEEAHEEVPRPPLPSVNRARGMFGVDYMGTVSQGSTSMLSSNFGLVTRLDITRIGGTFWNVRGYWRGRLSSQSIPGQQTLQDLINRTYHLNMTYENPNSRLVAGFGRLYLPWAPSLDTIDGGYFGIRLSHGGTAGVFAGSTPDPTSFSYNPDGEIGGAFINFEGGSYDTGHYTSTSGVGINAVKWQITRPFVFFENSISYKRVFSIYDSLQADSPSGNPAVPAPGAGLSRNFLTIRVAPRPWYEISLNHTYFRDIPTFDPQLIGTGLLDKYLFQGFSVGGRLQVWKQVWVYSDIGQSNRTGDAKSSLNQAFGITFNRIPKIDTRVDLHYSRFNSSFGTGSYRALSVARNVSEALRLQVLFGDESFVSSLTSNNTSRFVNATAETSFAAHYYLQGGFTVDRGSMNYNQWMFTLGYRFDSRNKHQ